MDVIDERNRKAKMAKMVVKRRNVIYNSLEEKEEEKPECDKRAYEILERLDKEHQEEEDKKRMEIEDLIAEQERKLMEVNRILNEKQELLQRTMQSAAMQEITLEEAVMEKVVEEALLGDKVK